MQETFSDQLGNQIRIRRPLARIVSIVPSQTELLADLGLNEEVVGITKFCVHPSHWRQTKTIVGGTKTLDLERIAALDPDLIIGNKEENTRAEIEWLQQRFPVWMSDVIDLDGALQMIEQVGMICHRADSARRIAEDVKTAFAGIECGAERRALYLIWRKPWMAAGPQTFIHEMLQLNGWPNAVAESRYPELSDEDIRSLDPEAILLSSEPYPFKEKHIAELQRLCPEARIHLVDGEMFSWYGSRLRLAPRYFASLSL